MLVYIKERSKANISNHCREKNGNKYRIRTKYITGRKYKIQKEKTYKRDKQLVKIERKKKIT